MSCDRHQNKVDVSLDGKPLPLATPQQRREEVREREKNFLINSNYK